MKKFASLLVALALVLSSVSALAAVVPSKTTGDVAAIVAITPGVKADVVDPDWIAEKEVDRIADCFIKGADLEDCFNYAVATDIAGASDLLDVVAIAVSGETEEETVEFCVAGASSFAGDIACVMGVYDSALNLYHYETLAVECNANGTANISMTAEQFEAAKAAESVLLAFVQL